jgi:hypothetical protein
VCQDIVKEFRKYDADPYKYFARFSGEHSVTGRVSSVEAARSWQSLWPPASTDEPSRQLRYHRTYPADSRNTTSTSATSASSRPRSSSTPKSTRPTS